MVNSYDKLTDELRRSCIRLSDELIFAPQKYGDEDFVHIEIPSVAKFYRVSYQEYVFISLFDGKTSIAHAQAVVAQSLGARAPTEEKCNQLVQWLLENGLAFLSESSETTSAKQSSNQKQKWFQKLNPFWIKIPLGNPDKFLARAHSHAAWMFHPLALVVSSILIVSAVAVGVSNFQQLANSSSNLLAPSNWLSMLLIWVFLKIIHEIGHGLTCRKFGGVVRDTGIIMILFAPMAYVDVTSSWRFKSRWHRIMVAGAGMYIELLVSAICLFAWFAISSPVIRQQLVNVIVMTSISTILFNANPLMRFDGYFILSDLLKIPNLYTTGTTAFQNHMKWLFFGQSEQRSCVEINQQRWLVTTYGYAATIWKVMICIGLAITASVMFHGMGVVISVFGVFSWFAMPAWKLIKDIIHRKNSKPHTVLRAMIVTGLLLITAVCAWTVVPNPFSSHCACIVDFEDAAKVRAESSGFVSDVFVEDGQFVEQGTPLLQLENAELQARVDGLRAELQQHLTQERIAIDSHNAADAQIAAKDAAATTKTLNQCVSELNALTLCAPNDGHVVSSRLKELVGQHIERGEHLLSVGEDSTKEIVLTIPPADIRTSTKILGRQIPIDIGSRRRILATIYRVDPKATRNVSQPKLISVNGGPLVVSMRNSNSNDGQDTSYELDEPHFQAFASLDAGDASKLFSGERGHAVLGSSSQTLGRFIFDSIHDWVQDQISVASKHQG